MKLAFSTLGCPEWNWDDVISAASDLGYDGVEIRGLSNELYAPGDTEFTSQHIEKTKTRLLPPRPCGPMPGFGLRLRRRDAATAQRSAEGRAYIDTARALGASFVRVMCEPTAAPEKKRGHDAREESACGVGRVCGGEGVISAA